MQVTFMCLLIQAYSTLDNMRTSNLSTAIDKLSMLVKFFSLFWLRVFHILNKKWKYISDKNESPHIRVILHFDTIYKCDIKH